MPKNHQLNLEGEKGGMAIFCRCPYLGNDLELGVKICCVFITHTAKSESATDNAEVICHGMTLILYIQEYLCFYKNVYG